MKILWRVIHALMPCVNKMVVEVDDRYTREYLEADKRSIANAVQIFYKDGSKSEKVEVEYPIGHKIAEG